MQKLWALFLLYRLPKLHLRHQIIAAVTARKRTWAFVGKKLLHFSKENFNNLYKELDFGT